MRRLSPRALRAIAYAIADETETRAAAIMARNPALSRVAAIHLALDAMANGKGH